LYRAAQNVTATQRPTAPRVQSLVAVQQAGGSIHAFDFDTTTQDSISTLDPQAQPALFDSSIFDAPFDPLEDTVEFSGLWNDYTFEENSFNRT